MNNKILKVKDLNVSIDTLIEAYRNGYRIEEASPNIEVKGLASCPTSIQQGTTKTITTNITGGTAPYTLNFRIDGTINSTWAGLSAGSRTFNKTFNESVGSHTYLIEVIDSCGTAQMAGDSCVINITAPTSAWTKTYRVLTAGGSIKVWNGSYSDTAKVLVGTATFGADFAQLLANGQAFSYEAVPSSGYKVSEMCYGASCTPNPTQLWGSGTAGGSSLITATFASTGGACPLLSTTLTIPP